MEKNRRYLVQKSKYTNVGLIDDTLEKLYMFHISGKLITNETTTGDLLSIILDTAETKKFKMIMVADILSGYKFKLIDLNNPKGCFHFNVETITNKIVDMNVRIHAHCKLLSLQMDHLYNLPGTVQCYNNIDELTLCLYYKGNCVSSIQMSYQYPETVSIDSQTGDEYQKKGFNKFLRSAAIILCGELKCNEKMISRLESYAVNHLSAWVLISNFDTEFPESDALNDEYSDIMKLHPNSSEIENFKKAFNKFKPLSIKVLINSENIDKAKQLFTEMLESKTLVCPKDGGTRRKQRQRQQKRRTKEKARHVI